MAYPGVACGIQALTDPGCKRKGAHKDECGNHGKRIGAERVKKILGQEQQGRFHAIQISETEEAYKGHGKSYRHSEEKEYDEQADAGKTCGLGSHFFIILLMHLMTMET